MTGKKRRWQKVSRDEYRYVEGLMVLATIKAERPNAGNYAIWVLSVPGDDTSYHNTTLRDTKRYAEWKLSTDVV